MAVDRASKDQLGAVPRRPTKFVSAVVGSKERVMSMNPVNSKLVSMTLRCVLFNASMVALLVLFRVTGVDGVWKAVLSGPAIAYAVFGAYHFVIRDALAMMDEVGL